MKHAIALLTLLFLTQYTVCSEKHNIITITSKNYNLEDSYPAAHLSEIKHKNGLNSKSCYTSLSQKIESAAVEFWLTERNKEALVIILTENLLYPEQEWAVTFKKKGNTFTIENEIGPIAETERSTNSYLEFDIYDNEYSVTAFNFGNSQE